MDRPVRVLMVAARYPPERGGVETHVSEVARRLGRFGIRVTVLATDRSGALPASSRDGDVEVIRVPAWPRDRDYYAAPGIIRVLSRGWDLVHVQGVHTLVAPLAMTVARIRRLPYVLTLHSGGHSSQLRNRMRPVQVALMGPLLARAERLVAVSRFEAALFGRSRWLRNTTFEVIPNGSDLPIVGRGTGGGAPLILSPGRLEAYKGHDRILGAMPHVLAAIPTARLAILGDGPDGDRLAAMARELGVERAIEIGAAADREAYARALSSASVVTQLSAYESQGIAVNEALAFGKPVVAAANTALLELAEQPLVALVDRDLPAPELAALLVRMIKQPSSGSPPALPTWDDCAAAIARVYREVLDA